MAVLRGVARGHEQLVAAAQRHVEVLRDVQDERAARPGAARLDARQVAGAHLGRVGERELAEPPLLAPGAEQRPDGGRSDGRHGPDGSQGGVVLAMTWQVMDGRHGQPSRSEPHPPPRRLR